jgi:hypothetical protein
MPQSLVSTEPEQYKIFRIFIIMKLLYTILVFIISLTVLSQNNETIWLGPNGQLDPVSQVMKKELEFRNKRKAIVKTYQVGSGPDKLLFTEHVSIKNPYEFRIRVRGQGFSESLTRTFKINSDGMLRFTDHQDGCVRRTGSTSSRIPLILQDTVREYYLNGSKKSLSLYRNNELLSNRNWKENGENYIDDIFLSVDEEPLFKPGTFILHNHIMNTFKNSLLDMSQVEGRLVVGFVVMETGDIDGIKIEQGLIPEINELAKKAFGSLNGEWKPARLNGENVRYYQLFPINFIYRQYDFNALELRGGSLYWDIN